MPARISDAEKLLGKVAAGWGNCLIWAGCISTTGYGRVSWGNPRRTEYAHRAAYETFVGPIPADRVIDHLCGNRRCINPQHLELVTRHENNHRGGTGGTAWCGRYGHDPRYCSPRCQHRTDRYQPRGLTAVAAFYDRLGHALDDHTEAVKAAIARVEAEHGPDDIITIPYVTTED